MREPRQGRQRAEAGIGDGAKEEVQPLQARQGSQVNHPLIRNSGVRQVQTLCARRNDIIINTSY